MPLFDQGRRAEEPCFSRSKNAATLHRAVCAQQRNFQQPSTWQTRPRPLVLEEGGALVLGGYSRAAGPLVRVGCYLRRWAFFQRGERACGCDATRPTTPRCRSNSRCVVRPWSVTHGVDTTLKVRFIVQRRGAFSKEKIKWLSCGRNSLHGRDCPCVGSVKELILQG